MGSAAPEGLGDEIANAVIQATGTVLSVIGLVILIRLALLSGGAREVSTVAVYGGTLVLAFLASALYHATWHSQAKRILHTVDHCTIYLLIAGTYTPVALLALPPDLGWILVAVVWTVALVGVLLRIVWPRRLHGLRISLYVVLGWLVVAWGKPVFDGLGPPGAGLLVAGGVAYMVGILFYRWQRLPFHRPVWHLFVIAGSACHFAAIAFYAIPAHSG